MKQHSQPQQRLKNLEFLLDFIEKAPENPEIIAMDCNDHCQEMATLAERVAEGVSLDAVLPELEEHMKYWGDCREEFYALVSLLKAELAGDFPPVPEISEKD
ncbi:hypothetical protein G4Y79_02330 [Phototrophicus methaneseepsis]|uniref:Uncharacterized protein n=1 Tax=Phototrophicus methaneseepsis TaxID=2710758 RepID=A0A7S8IFR9_9CHLR|nr:hypothetical protein [Phototrophicus methaneseepsis]QPC83233.1 hypothetical protein G4Y79_02330 [Phototrophicus methaneseepsis]